MGEISNSLEYSDQVIYPTNKTNTFRSISMNNMNTVSEHIVNLAKDIDRDKVFKI